MRPAFALLLLCGTALAAPVKPDPKAERTRLESLWRDLQARDPVVRTRAVLAFLDHPQAVPFLTEKLPPVRASKEQVTAWLKDLNDTDEKARDAAVEQLRYFDPRIALTVTEQVELATTEFARRKLMALWHDHETPWPAGATTILEVQKETADGTQVLIGHLTPKANGAESVRWTDTIDPVARHRSHTWKSVELVALALDRIGTPAARDVLKRLATGHPDAHPTRVALSLAQPVYGPPAPLTEQGFDRIWQELGDWNPVASARGVAALVGDSKAVGFLKPKVRPIRADKKQTLTWLADLNDEDKDTWQPAYRSLMYYQPQLAIPLDEQIEAMTSNAGRCRLFALHKPSNTDVAVVYVENVSLKVEGHEFICTHQIRGRPRNMGVTIPPIEELSPAPWRQVRLAALALERAGTPEAVAVLKQLADGHPDVLPTKDAKASLKRLEK